MICIILGLLNIFYVILHFNGQNYTKKKPHANQVSIFKCLQAGSGFYVEFLAFCENGSNQANKQEDGTHKNELSAL